MLATLNFTTMGGWDILCPQNTKQAIMEHQKATKDKRHFVSHQKKKKK